MANQRDKMVSMMDKRMELWLMESAEEFAGLALRCSDDSPEMRQAMAEVVKELLENHTNQPTNINAFDIIALSTGFDLARLFGDVYNKRESRFTSQKPASVIISKLEEVAQRLKLSIRKREAGLFKLERLKEGRKGILSIDA